MNAVFSVLEIGAHATDEEKAVVVHHISTWNRVSLAAAQDGVVHI